jgi:hypothetical protein
MKTQRLRVIVLGYVVRGPLGGMAWHHLNYVLGLAELGHDVYFIEDSDDYPCCYDPSRNQSSEDPTYGLRFADRSFTRLGLGDRWAYYDAHTGAWMGARAGDAEALCRSADLVLNVSGVNPLRDWLARVPARALIDTDPGFTQVRHLQDSAARERAAGHTAFFTFGENIDKPNCGIPCDGFPWRPTRQPVSLAAWPRRTAPRGGRYTTVMQWESYPPLRHGQLTLAMKSTSFRAFAKLPERLGPVFMLAIGGAGAPRASLRDLGWGVADATAVSEDPWTYQDFILASKAEFGIAKDGYVATRSSWFSERSACYLASGRPVLAQDTGFSDWLPCGEGVLAFASPADVTEAVASIDADYERHCRRARAVAAEYFAPARVLPHLIEAAVTQQRVAVRCDGR